MTPKRAEQIAKLFRKYNDACGDLEEGKQLKRIHKEFPDIGAEVFFTYGETVTNCLVTPHVGIIIDAMIGDALDKVKRLKDKLETL